MEVRLDPDVQAKLTRIAAERGSNAELLAREAIEFRRLRRVVCPLRNL